MPVETALISLGTVAVRTATKLWLGDHKIAAELGGAAVDQLSAKLTKERDRRKFVRLMDDFAEAVVDRLEPIIETEFRTLAENDQLAAIEAVRDTFDGAALDDTDLFAADLDAGHLDPVDPPTGAQPDDIAVRGLHGVVRPAAARVLWLCHRDLPRTAVVLGERTD
ncbi:hypothetical protein [Lentzea sp. NPDC051838]|uniref:NACHT N-terminal Helical domain 1-containing protein n=1 Tax=Lentzea sp. NPDC051838 TaxID=3154849 RepID=UPI0034470778